MDSCLAPSSRLAVGSLMAMEPPGSKAALICLWVSYRLLEVFCIPCVCACMRACLCLCRLPGMKTYIDFLTPVKKAVR